MRQMSSPVNRPVSTTTDPDDVLGQFYFAFGQGAGTMRVRREAIAALRRRYYPPIQAGQVPWTDIAGSVLSLLAQVGRLATLLATQAGRTAIGEAEFTQARLMVERGAHEQTKAAGLFAGPMCPHYPEDDSRDLPDAEGLQAPSPAATEVGSVTASAVTVN